MATSGDYRNFYEANGKRYAHILNPKTGQTVRRDVASATVIAETCGAADAWATALVAAGPEDAMRLANKNNLSVFLILRGEDSGFIVRSSDKFQSDFPEVVKGRKPADN